MVSPVTLLANLLVVPASSAALACNLGSLFCNQWLPWATELFNFSGWWWMECMVRLSDWALLLPKSHFYVRSPTLQDFSVYYGLLFVAFSGCLSVPRWRRWVMASLPVIASVYLVQWLIARDETRLHILPLDGGTSVFCQSSRSGKDLLIDCGRSNLVEFVTEPFLHAQGVNRLPWFLLTHGDAQHVGGAGRIVGVFNPGHVWASPVRFRSPVYRSVMSDLSCVPEQLGLLSRGDRLGGWKVLHPASTNAFSTADDNALVLLGNWHGTRVLLLSDLGRKGQEALLEREEDLKADIVVAGVPSAGEPLCDGLLEAVCPKVIVVTDAEFPSRERATERVKNRLENCHVPVLYTRTAGAVRIRVWPGGWEVKGLQTAVGSRGSGVRDAGK